MSTPAALDLSALPSQVLDLRCPQLEEVAKVLEEGLKVNFERASVKVVDCPDLSQHPFGLAAPGLGGEAEPCILDIGGVPYLEPVPDRRRIYNLRNLPGLLPGFGGEAGRTLVLGAGAGPWPSLGTNCEMAANILMEGPGAKVACNKTRFALVGPGGECVVKDAADETSFCLMANLIATKGKQQGKVLEVAAEGRKGKDDFVGCMRKALQRKYPAPGAPVGLGGAFVVAKGKSHVHVMPDFPSKPFGDGDVGRWLKFYDFDGPMAFMSVFVSHDPGLSLRVEHSHGWSSESPSDGAGHYHYDVTPESVKYVGYYTMAPKLMRLDRPQAPWTDPVLD